MDRKKVLVILLVLIIAGCQKANLKPEASIPSPVVVEKEKPITAESLKKQYKENPEMTKPVLEEAVNIAVSNSPGMAIEVESYANEETKSELAKMKEELRSLKQNFSAQSSNGQEIENLKRSNARLVLRANALESENSRLQGKEADLVKKAEFLQKDNIELKEASLASLEELKKANSELGQRISALETENSELRQQTSTTSVVSYPVYQAPASPVSVLIHNTWNRTNAFIILTSLKTGERWSITLPYQRGSDREIVSLLPGEYTADFYLGNVNNFYRRKSLTVTPDISASYYCEVHRRYAGYSGVLTSPN